MPPGGDSTKERFMSRRRQLTVAQNQSDRHKYLMSVLEMIGDCKSKILKGQKCGSNNLSDTNGLVSGIE